jgi:hypothetical protein
VLRVGAVAFLAALAFAGTASAFTRTAVFAAANQVRAQYGEPPLRVVPYRESDGGWEVEQTENERTPLEVIGNWTDLLAQLIDPRVQTVAARAGLGGVIQLELGPAVPGRLTTAVVPRRLDPGLPIDVAVLLPSRNAAKVSFAELRAGAWLEVPAQIDKAKGVFGSQVVDIQVDRPAYDATYRLIVGGNTFVLRTSPPPAAFLAKSWTFGPTMTPDAVATVQQAFAAAPPLVQQLADELDGAVTFELQSCVGGDPKNSCMRETGNTFHIDINPDDVTAFTVLHEFGHVVDTIGLDVAGELEMQKLFATSPDWLDCFFYRPLGCVPPEELLADQFAFWATGISPVDVSYGDPPLIQPDQFAALLEQQFAFRPGYAADPARARP